MTKDKMGAELAEGGFEDNAIHAALHWQRTMGENVGPGDFALMSAALSLKRIADAMQLPTVPPFDVLFGDHPVHGINPK